MTRVSFSTSRGVSHITCEEIALVRKHAADLRRKEFARFETSAKLTSCQTGNGDHVLPLLPARSSDLLSKYILIGREALV